MLIISMYDSVGREAAKLFENSNTATEKDVKQVEKTNSFIVEPATEQKTTTPWGQFWKKSFNDAKNVKVASEGE